MLDSFELQASALLIPRDSWQRLLPLYLCDAALLTYRNLVDKKPYLEDDYDDLVKALNKEFQVTSGISSSVELYNRKKQSSESVGKFYASITAIAKRVYPKMDVSARDQIILGAFLQGLDTSFQRRLLNNQKVTTSE
jgi:hypothetical protein